MNNGKPSKSIDSSNLNKWINRSLDQPTHVRLYNEAKIQSARLNDKRIQQRNPEIDGCTFQPKLVFNSYITQKMLEGRMKSVEDKNVRFQKEVQMFGIKVDKSQNKKNARADNSSINMKFANDEKCLQKQPEMVNRLKRMREKEAAKLAKQKYADENVG